MRKVLAFAQPASHGRPGIALRRSIYCRPFLRFRFEVRMLRPTAKPWLLALVALACLCQAGCVQRRLTIRSNPPGALVYVDNHEIGTTPVATDFIYYGTRQIRLVKDGYETLTVLQPVPTPWYQYFPIDFFAENIVPGEIRDERVFDFVLTPQIIVPGDQLLQRAEDLRRTTRIPNLLAPPPQPGTVVPPIEPLPPVR
jgi:hypothetical protein